MAKGRYAHEERRVLNPHGRRHYRRSYSLTEVKVGAVILLLMGIFLGWIAWMGAHPDPSLFANGADLLDPGTPAVERGPLPEGLAGSGFSEGPVSRFDGDSLFKKINGRAPYFKTRGFVALTFVSLSHDEDAGRAVDVELYDMGSSENALGTYAGEKGQGVKSEQGRTGLWHRERNALYLAAGQYYLRAIGSDESEQVGAQLQRLRERLDGALGGPEGELPWAHALLSEGLGAEVGDIRFLKENAFSFGFARQVYALTLPDGETEVFVVAAADGAAAQALAKRYREGFESYGEALEMDDGPWVKDRYLSSFSTVRALGSLLAGVRGAPDEAAATAALHKLSAVVAAAPEPLRVQALASVPADAAAELAGEVPTEAATEVPTEAAAPPQGTDEGYDE